MTDSLWLDGRSGADAVDVGTSARRLAGQFVEWVELAAENRARAQKSARAVQQQCISARCLLLALGGGIGHPFVLLDPGREKFLHSK